MTYKERLIKAVFHNQYGLVKDLLTSDEFDKKILDDTGIFEYAPFPLYYITMCYKHFMWNDYIKEVMPMVLRHRKNIDALLELWKNEYGIDVTQKIDYKKYERDFFCTEDSKTTYDVLWDPVEKFLKAGFRRIDIDLYEAVEKFHFDEAEILLKQGANPDVDLLPIDDLDSNDPWNCLDRIGNECSYLCTCEVFFQLKIVNEHWYQNWPITSKEIGDLIGLAAHEDMYKLLIQYVD